MRAGKVSDSDNLNVFTETGWYEIPTSGQATLDKNYPINKTGGILYVHTSGAGTLQVYYAYTGDSNYVKICTCHYFKTTGFWSNWDIYIRTSDLNWQYAAWTRLAGGGAGTYVSTYYSPYMILVRGSFNAQMSSLNHIAWYDAGLYYYPFAKINQNLWNLKAEAPPLSTFHAIFRTYYNNQIKRCKRSAEWNILCGCMDLVGWTVHQYWAVAAEHDTYRLGMQFLHIDEQVCNNSLTEYRERG
ncbi:MAG: hypothetical protein HFE83_11915 [Lachnospiraceae bacterium]|nr:hypothetical protein [Lachnospiraceae bacterium]